ncbi:MAG: cell division protein FtsA [Candidatus Magasanikbacteria bacterium]|nr:cell division protein FtsA [Candidatus Magasanikbacteria bacterium]
MRKNRNKIELITGLDIGSTAIRIAVAQQMTNKNGDRELQLVGVVEIPSEGVHKGTVSSIEETVSSISDVLEKIERLIGVPVTHAWVGMAGFDILSQDSAGVIAVAKSDGEISSEDIRRAIEASQNMVIPANYELLHVLPRNFTVDGQTGIKDPTGMTGIRMEVSAQIIHGVTSHINNLKRAVYRAGLDIEDIVLSVLATGEVVTTQKQKELGSIVINIGGATTSIIVYEGGDILHTAVIPIGSEYITNDLALVLKTSIDVAEKVKIEWGNCVPESISEYETIDLFNLGSKEHEEVTLRLIAEIVGTRVSEILEKVDQELMKIDRSGLLPAGAILTGGGAKINGLIELTKEELRLPATLGYPIGIQSAPEEANDLAFSTAIGLVKWGSVIQNSGLKSSNKLIAPVKVWQVVRKIFNSFIP